MNLMEIVTRFERHVQNHYSKPLKNTHIFVSTEDRGETIKLKYIQRETKFSEQLIFFNSVCEFTLLPHKCILCTNIEYKIVYKASYLIRLGALQAVKMKQIEIIFLLLPLCLPNLYLGIR